MSTEPLGKEFSKLNPNTPILVGAGLAGMSPINVKFRYLDDEQLDLCNGLDIQVLVYDSEFAQRVARIHEHLTDYKVPKQIFAIDSLQRAANGKSIYPFVTNYAEEQAKLINAWPNHSFK